MWPSSHPLTCVPHPLENPAWWGCGWNAAWSLVPEKMNSLWQYEKTILFHSLSLFGTPNVRGLNCGDILVFFWFGLIFLPWFKGSFITHDFHARCLCVWPWVSSHLKIKTIYRLSSSSSPMEALLSQNTSTGIWIVGFFQFQSTRRNRLLGFSIHNSQFTRESRNSGRWFYLVWVY
jgi:hypothetical protein